MIGVGGGACRSCHGRNCEFQRLAPDASVSESIIRPPAPFPEMPRGFTGPNLLAMILFDKFGQHQPLTRQSDRFAREGIDLSVSTLADQSLSPRRRGSEPARRLLRRCMP
jgi:transposase